MQLDVQFSGGVLQSAQDHYATRQARENRASNTTLLIARGNATCLCHPFFDGADCSQGECPAGHELLEANPGSYYCVECMEGSYKSEAGNNVSCEPCMQNHFAPNRGSQQCQPCGSGVVKHTSVRGRAVCQPDPWSVSTAVLGAVAVALAGLLLPVLVGSSIPIQDISCKKGYGVVVTTAKRHLLLATVPAPFQRLTAPHATVILEGTGVPWLDTAKPSTSKVWCSLFQQQMPAKPSSSLRALVLDPCSLQLCDEEGTPLQDPAEAKSGYAREPRDVLGIVGIMGAP